MGRIMNQKSKILKQQYQNSGYKIIHLYKDNIRKAITVHRIVALTFLQKRDGCDFINHKNGLKKENNSENLEWCTQTENARHAVKNGLFKVYKRTEKQRELMSERMSKLHKGVPKSKEHCLRMSIDRKGILPKCVTDRLCKNYRKVQCIETNIVYPTMKDAADSIGIDNARLRRHLYYGTQYPQIKLTYKLISDEV